MEIGDRVRQTCWDSSAGAAKARVGARGTIVALTPRRYKVEFDTYPGETFGLKGTCLEKEKS